MKDLIPNIRINLPLAFSSSFVLAALLCSQGCVMVRPHERALLSKRVMQPAGDRAEAKLDNHIYENREAAAGGGGSGAGGCGCN